MEVGVKGCDVQGVGAEPDEFEEEELKEDIKVLEDLGEG